jgi:16S rRNA (cytosine967-C5)-methyltransferase
LADSRRVGQGARATAAVVVRGVACGRSLSDMLSEQLGRLSPDQRPLAQELSFGALRWYTRLQVLLAGLLERPLKARNGDLQALLLIGLYQLQYTSIPAHAAVAETVEAVRCLGKAWACSLVNGVLRRFLRERPAWQARADACPEGLYSTPSWLMERLRQAWPGRWEAILAASNDRPPMTLRVNRLKVDQEDYVRQLRDAGLAARALSDSETGVQLESAVPVDRLPGFAEGLASVQDAGAQLAAGLLDARPGQWVLDACAAPGGKTCHILELQPDLAGLAAVDLDTGRLQQVRENLDRLGLSADLSVGDAAEPSGPWGARIYDRILLDAPCTATGVIRRHPDIRVLRRDEDVPALAARQSRMLAALWPLLRQGGILLYATCSLMPEENERQVQRFLSLATDARERPIRADWGHARAVGRQTLPGERGMDGFYYACIEKV